MVSPAVGETDQAVMDLLFNSTMTLDEAMFEVALSDRRYSWSVLYRCLDADPFAGPPVLGRTYRFYTFTLRVGIPEARYAMQILSALDPLSPDYGLLLLRGPAEDRRVQEPRHPG